MEYFQSSRTHRHTPTQIAGRNFFLTAHFGLSVLCLDSLQSYRRGGEQTLIVGICRNLHSRRGLLGIVADLRTGNWVKRVVHVSPIKTNHFCNQWTECRLRRAALLNSLFLLQDFIVVLCLVIWWLPKPTLSCNFVLRFFCQGPSWLRNHGGWSATQHFFCQIASGATQIRTSRLPQLSHIHVFLRWGTTLEGRRLHCLRRLSYFAELDNGILNYWCRDAKVTCRRVSTTCRRFPRPNRNVLMGSVSVYTACSLASQWWPCFFAPNRKVVSSSLGVFVLWYLTTVGNSIHMCIHAVVWGYILHAFHKKWFRRGLCQSTTNTSSIFHAISQNFSKRFFFLRTFWTFFQLQIFSAGSLRPCDRLLASWFDHPGEGGEGAGAW